MENKENLREEVLRELEFKKLFEDFRREAFRLGVSLKRANPEDIFSDLARWIVKKGYYLENEPKNKNRKKENEWELKISFMNKGYYVCDTKYRKLDDIMSEIKGFLANSIKGLKNEPRNKKQ